MTSPIENSCNFDSTNSPLAQVELISRFLFFGIALAVLLLSFVMTTDSDQRIHLPGSSIPLPTTCTSRWLLGLECPGCGLTRAFIAIGHGRFQQAWHFHRVSFFVFLFVAGQVPWQLLQLRRTLTQRPLLSLKVFWLLPTALAGLLFTNWMLKLVGV